MRSVAAILFVLGVAVGWRGVLVLAIAGRVTMKRCPKCGRTDLQNIGEWVLIVSAITLGCLVLFGGCNAPMAGFGNGQQNNAALVAAVGELSVKLASMDASTGDVKGEVVQGVNFEGALPFGLGALLAFGMVMFGWYGWMSDRRERLRIKRNGNHKGE